MKLNPGWKIMENPYGRPASQHFPGPLGGRTTAAAGGGSCGRLGSQQAALPGPLYGAAEETSGMEMWQEHAGTGLSMELHSWEKSSGGIPFSQAIFMVIGENPNGNGNPWI